MSMIEKFKQDMEEWGKLEHVNFIKASGERKSIPQWPKKPNCTKINKLSPVPLLDFYPPIPQRDIPAKFKI
jgi:hypothetical protein